MIISRLFNLIDSFCHSLIHLIALQQKLAPIRELVEIVPDVITYYKLKVHT